MIYWPGSAGFSSSSCLFKQKRVKQKTWNKKVIHTFFIKITHLYFGIDWLHTIEIFQAPNLGLTLQKTIKFETNRMMGNWEQWESTEGLTSYVVTGFVCYKLCRLVNYTFLFNFLADHKKSGKHVVYVNETRLRKNMLHLIYLQVARKQNNKI